MNKHILGLDFPDTSCEHILKVVDSSLYSKLLNVDCERLDIIVPNLTHPVYIDVSKGFILNLSASDLGIISEDSDEVYNLPDGIYKISYSVSPNDKTIVTYSILRVVSLLNKYYKELCKLNLEKCEQDVVILQRLKDLRFIKSLIDAAKSKVDYCKSPKQGLEMYNYAKDMLNNYINKKCITCN